MVFVNFTNHPSKFWCQSQIDRAQEYGRIVDVPFPMVDATGDEEYIAKLADSCIEQIMQNQPSAVLCQGEFCLAYQVIKQLKELGVEVLAACSQRCVREYGNRKEVLFEFQQFRRYE